MYVDFNSYFFFLFLPVMKHQNQRQLTEERVYLGFDSSLQRQAMAVDDRHGDAELTFLQQQQQQNLLNRTKENQRNQNPNIESELESRERLYTLKASL